MTTRIDENIGLAAQALGCYLETFDIAALARTKAYLDLASAGAGRLLGLEDASIAADRTGSEQVGCAARRESGGPASSSERASLGRASSGRASAVERGGTHGARRQSPRKPVRYPETGKMRRRAFAVARDFGLATGDGAAMREALSRFLHRPVASRRDLSEHEWRRIAWAIEQLELWW